ncbi:acyltransferase family protein [Bradyrhizobium icense]|nr:acyltransferase [Bradyrhizobium icense]
MTFEGSRRHCNNFGFLRLLFASLVIISHSAEIIDGNRSREWLVSIGGTMTLGEVAVDGFFLISGYLVLQSFQNSTTVYSYIIKRVRRIYPGFIFAYVTCFFVVAPFAGVDFGSLKFTSYLKYALQALMLNGPDLYAFPSMPVHALNGPTWTIVYEFRCYLLIVLIAGLGLYKWPLMFAALSIGLLLLNEVGFFIKVGALGRIIGNPMFLVRLASLFCIGSCFYLFRSKIRFRVEFAIIACTVLTASIYFSKFQEAVFAIFGGYLIFYVALHIKSRVLVSINSRVDISYGVYLYAWPIQISLAYFFGIHSPWTLTIIATPFAYVAGLLSWHFIERPFLVPAVAERRTYA